MAANNLLDEMINRDDNTQSFSDFIDELNILTNLSPKEKEYREIWNETRTTILNKGNNQLRAAIEEVSLYSMKWEKYQTEFIIKKD